MEEADQDLDFDGAAHAALPPAVVTLAPFSYIPSPSRRRLSSLNFTQSSRPVPPPPKNVAWLSLQGRLVNAEEASSARAIGGGLSREEAVAWELFSPIQRFLLVAVIGVAVAESKKNQLIWQLTKSVELRVSNWGSQSSIINLTHNFVNIYFNIPGSGVLTPSVTEYLCHCLFGLALRNGFAFDIHLLLIVCLISEFVLVVLKMPFFRFR